VSVVGSLTNDKMEGIWKEAVVVHSRFYLGICMKALRKPTENLSGYATSWPSFETDTSEMQAQNNTAVTRRHDPVRPTELKRFLKYSLVSMPSYCDVITILLVTINMHTSSSCQTECNVLHTFAYQMCGQKDISTLRLNYKPFAQRSHINRLIKWRHSFHNCPPQLTIALKCWVLPGK
jgi:hypothetical protein